MTLDELAGIAPIIGGLLALLSPAVSYFIKRYDKIDDGEVKLRYKVNAAAFLGNVLFALGCLVSMGLDRTLLGVVIIVLSLIPQSYQYINDKWSKDRVANLNMMLNVGFVSVAVSLALAMPLIRDLVNVQFDVIRVLQALGDLVRG